jgi:hypothetical protein
MPLKKGPARCGPFSFLQTESERRFMERAPRCAVDAARKIWERPMKKLFVSLVAVAALFAFTPAEAKGGKHKGWHHAHKHHWKHKHHGRHYGWIRGNHYGWYKKGKVKVYYR